VTVATLVARNAKEAMVGSAFGGSLESDGRFCVGAFGSRRKDVFTFNLLLRNLIHVLSMWFAKIMLQ
jgi:hypothetical protein